MFGFLPLYNSYGVFSNFVLTRIMLEIQQVILKVSAQRLCETFTFAYHGPCYVYESLIFPFCQYILLRSIQTEKIMNNTVLIIDGSKIIIFKLCYMIRPYGFYKITFFIMQLFNLAFESFKMIVFMSYEFNTSISRLVVHYNQIINSTTNALNSSWTKQIHMQKFERLCSRNFILKLEWSLSLLIKRAIFIEDILLEFDIGKAFN